MATDYQYATWEANLVADVEIDAAVDLGVNEVRGGYIINDDLVNDMAVQFSFNGTVYGDEVTIKAQEELTLDVFVKFKKVKLVHKGSNVDYRVLISLSSVKL